MTALVRVRASMAALRTRSNDDGGTRRRRTVIPGEKFVLERRDMHDQAYTPVYRLRKIAL